MLDCARYATHIESEVDDVLRRVEKSGILIRREYEPQPLNGESLHVTENGNTTYFVLEASEDRLTMPRSGHFPGYGATKNI
jgi:hypothetical protein